MYCLRFCASISTGFATQNLFAQQFWGEVGTLRLATTPPTRWANSYQSGWHQLHMLVELRKARTLLEMAKLFEKWNMQFVASRKDGTEEPIAWWNFEWGPSSCRGSMGGVPMKLFDPRAIATVH